MIVAFGAHPDDVVLSAGAWLSWQPEVVACTVFAGDPPPFAALSAYDRESGFSSAAEAMHVRRAEDDKACAKIGAVAQHLPLLDGQYRGGEPYEPELLQRVLREVVDVLQPSLILAPLGIVHDDHVALAAACWHAFRYRPECQLVFAEDLPYRIDDPAAAVFEVAGKGVQWFWPEACPDDEAALRAKIAALSEYRSQLWALPSFVYYVPERLWLAWHD